MWALLDTVASAPSLPLEHRIRRKGFIKLSKNIDLVPGRSAYGGTHAVTVCYSSHLGGTNVSSILTSCATEEGGRRVSFKEKPGGEDE